MRTALGLLLSLFTLAAVAEPPTPLLWRVDGDSGHLYLLGSAHMLKPTDYPLAAAVDQAYAEAEELVLELSPAEMRSGTAGAKMMKLGALPAGESLRDHVSDECWSAVMAYVDGGGFLPLSAIERMRPWMLALTLAVMETQRFGLDPAYGLEQHLLARQAADGKDGAGLETIEQQLSLFTDVGRDEQDQQLLQTLRQLPQTETFLARMHSLWRSGDADGLDALMRESMAGYPELYRRFVVERNRAWLAPLESHIADEGDELVVVGAAHLGGETGVVALLRQRGYRVSRVGGE